jgi:hypothetical protein
MTFHLYIVRDMMVQLQGSTGVQKQYVYFKAFSLSQL